MILESMEPLPQPGQGEELIHCPVPIPSVTAYFCRFPAAGERGAAPIAAGHVQAVLCKTGRLQIQTTDGHTEAVGPGELLLLTWKAQAERLSLTFAPADFLVADGDTQAVGGLFSPQFFSPSDLLPDAGALGDLLDAHGGCLVLRDPDWSSFTLAALRRLPPERQGVYFILRLLERLYLLCGEGLPDTAGSRAGYYDTYQREAVRKVHDYILENLEQPVTIQQLAQTFQMSPTYLKEGFRRIYGKPIHTYLQQYRLQKAAHLLCTTSERVLSIASQVGYSGTSRFNAAFKEMYHVTPIQYRQMHREKMSKTGD